MMDWLKKLAEDPAGSLRNQVIRFTNRTFLDAVVAGCALVAAADGTIDPAEKQKMVGFIQHSSELKVFTTAEVIAAFQESASAFEFDFEIGKIEALKKVARLKGNPEACRTMVRVCCIIGASDGNFDADEKKAVAGICKAVGLEPAEFDL